MIAILAALALQAEAPTPEQLQGLEHIFAQSCADRAYGQYDDMCDSIAGQIRRVRTEIARRPKPKPAPAPAQPSPATGTADPAKASAEPALKPPGD
jgi:hypothetical protein